MADFKQAKHPLRIDTPLGADALLVDRFEGIEAISSPFEFRLWLRSSRKSIDATQLVGQSSTLTVERAGQGNLPRNINGIVTRFENLGQVDRDYCLYLAELRPWFWLLSQTTDCRIFQKQSALDIVKTVLNESGFGTFESKVNGSPAQRDYCVQYNESDQAFVSRLLEEEGIYYFFRHESKRHVMVLADDSSAIQACAESTVSLKSVLSAPGGTDRLKAWSHGFEVATGKWAARDYDFEKPTADLLSTATGNTRLTPSSKLERFEYPGTYTAPDVGNKLATIRAEQDSLLVDTVRGESVVEAFAAGTRFTIGEHHTESEKGKQFVLTEVRHHGQQLGTYGESNEKSDAPPYSNSFVAVPSTTKLRPVRRTRKPRIAGPQTALVVGPPGEEVWTDKYGRIKVQFHWDRYGKKDDGSSCWIRVAFASAGASWGLLALPRIGYEVLVEFIDGDPDRPVATGCVYNAQNMPPVSNAGRKGSAPSDVPGARMMTTLRSQSFKKTGGFNEITMNDTSNAEGLFIKAQKDEIHKVGNDREDEVSNNQSTTIGKKDTLKVGDIQEITITKDQTLKVGGDQKITITGKGSETAREIELTGQMKITLKCGGSTIELTPAMITISAPMVKIN